MDQDDQYSEIDLSGIYIPNLKRTAPHHSSTSIRQLLSELKPNSTVKVFARSASTWAELYEDIQNVINEKEVHFEVIIADDNAIMATLEDHGKYDLDSSLNKFSRISLNSTTRGSFSLYRNPTFLLFSYVSWETNSNEKKGWLTIGASLNKSQQRSLEVRYPSPFKNNLDAVYERVRLGSTGKGFVIDREGLRELHPKTLQGQSEKIFIVHGRNQKILDQIDLYLTKELGLTTCVMQAGPYKGRTLPEKFEQMASDCSFAVFILTADDSFKKPSSRQVVKHARQNVILELGYFWGALGRSGTVAFLIENDPELELPSDIQGIGWIPITSDLAETKLRLYKELKEKGIV